MNKEIITMLEIVNHVLSRHPNEVLPYIKNITSTDNVHVNGNTNIDIIKSFPEFVPCSAGSYNDRANLTIQGINQVFPFLAHLIESVHGSLIQVEDLTSIRYSEEEVDNITQISKIFTSHGSDKATTHNYHLLYGKLLKNKEDVLKIFEIGLGTNNIDVVSNMGRSGKPGASLRSFRDFCKNAKIYGADIDKRILFSEERIETHYIDQTDLSSFDNLISNLEPNSFDLFIDDGLHSPNANIASLNFGLKLVKKDGWVVIEDICKSAVSVWQVISYLLPSNIYESHIYRDRMGAILFAVRKLH